MLIPVAVTTTSPRPRVTTVFMWTMPVRSARGASAGAAAVVFATGLDSPVSADSSTSSEWATTMRPSAGTRSPASTSTTSPGTSPGAATSVATPSRRTRAVATSICRRAARLRSARCSWTKPSTALTSSTMAMTTVSLRSPTSPASTAAPTSTMIRRLRNWSTNTCQGERRAASASSFGPLAANRAATARSSSPRAGSTPRRWTTSAAATCQGCSAEVGPTGSAAVGSYGVVAVSSMGGCLLSWWWSEGLSRLAAGAAGLSP